MNTQEEIMGMVATEAMEAVATPLGFERGYTIEHIMLSVTVVHTNQIMQYDDSCANILKDKLGKEYNGVVRVDANVLYDHSKTDVHHKGCDCGTCNPQWLEGQP